MPTSSPKNQSESRSAAADLSGDAAPGAVASGDAAPRPLFDPAGLGHPRRLAWAFGVVALAFFAFMAAFRTPIGHVWADEGTFLAMMESLVEDRDLRFDHRDLARIESAAAPDPGRGYLILQKVGDGPEVSFSKPIVYPLLAAPFLAVFGAFGPVVLNVLLLVAALSITCLYLRRLAARTGVAEGLADLAVVGFACAAVVVPYVFWRMADLAQLCFALAGLVLVVAPLRLASDGAGESGDAWSRSWVQILGTVLVATLVAMRVSNGVLALVPAAIYLVHRRWRRGLLLLAVTVATLIAWSGLSVVLTGASDPYRAVRASFTPQTGYPVAPDDDQIMERFDENRASHVTTVATPGRARRVAYSALYFWAGRHTGLFVYFPAALLLLVCALRRPDRIGVVALLAFSGTVVFFVGWKPDNYFGGETFLGNRYVLSAYPALLVALRRLPSVRQWLATWLLALVVFVSAAVSVARVENLGGPAGPGSQSHTHAGLFRVLPYESTARNIDGRVDRYWSGQFLRFVDPYAEVGGVGFELHAGRPAAEVMLATWRLPEMLRMRASSDAVAATLHVEGGGVHQKFAIGSEVVANAGGAGAEIVLDLGSPPRAPWRRHGYWFGDALYWVLPMRFWVESDDSARAVVWFLGDPVRHERSFAVEVLDAHVPKTVPVGGVSDVRLRIRNTSQEIWRRDDVTPVRARWRLLGPAADGMAAEPAVVAESPRIDLPSDLEPGAEAELAFSVDWPAAPGDYVLEVDLVLEHVDWFADRLGEPTYRSVVTVREAS